MFKITRKLVLSTALLGVSAIGLAQVGIGTTTPNPDAELDITSTNRGLLLPRVALTATTSPTPLTADVAGMTVYNTATAGDVTPGFYYNDGVIWVRIGGGTPNKDWMLTGNSGTIPGTNYVGTSDNVDLYLSRNGIDQIRFTSAEILVNENSHDVDFIVESDNNNALFWIDGASDRVAVNGGAIYGGTNLSVTSTTGNAAAIFSNDSTGDALFSQNLGSGIAVNAIAGGGSTGSAFSASNFSTNSNAITAFFIANNGGTGVYADNTFGGANDGTTGDAIVGISNADGGFGGGWFTNDSDGNGTTWEPATTPVGILGQTLEAATYHAGVFGSADGGSNNSASVLGQMGSGGFVDATGALGYRATGGAAYHGGFFFATGGAADHSDGTFRSSNQTDNTYTRIGSGSRGDLMGSWAKGDLYGMVISGKRIGLYIEGREFTNDISTQIHATADRKVATYNTTSTNVDITTRGNNKLSNGTTYVRFKRDFSSIISSKERINVTITPIGESNGIHIVSVDTNGFTVKENQNGNSSIEFNWTAIGTKSGYENVRNPKELLETDYDEKLNKFFEGTSFYAEKQNIAAGEMWWDGSQMRYHNTPNINSSIDYKKKYLPKISSPKEESLVKKSIKSERSETK